MQPSAQEGRFVVGVDFGTTFSSVVFAHSISAEEVKLVQSWPNGSNGSGSADQVPTELKYTHPSTRNHLCGYEIPGARRKSSEPLKWFKLLLQGNAANTEGSDTLSTPAARALQQLRALNIRPEEAVEDFLATIRKVTLESIGTTYDEEFVKNSQIDFVITIPAIWSDSAKALMISAAEKARYGRHRTDFHLVSEPEAAAAYTLKVIQPHEFKKGETFIICDAGGGTVDLIAYKIEALQPLRIDEVVSGSGDLCGSVYLDHGFRAYMEEKIGREVLAGMSDRSKTAMYKCWEEQVKFKFATPTQNAQTAFEVVVPGIPDNEELEIEEGFHTMSCDSVDRIFDPVVSKIIRLVRDQVAAVESSGNKVTAILLVGGFGCSPYLFHRLRTESFGVGRRRLQIIQPVNARTAIARGALLRGLDGSIVRDKRARRSYGTSFSTSRIPRREEARKYWDQISGCWRIGGRLSWPIKKDEILTNQFTAGIELQCHVRVNSRNMVFEYRILGSDQHPPPTWTWRPGAETYPVCTLVADLGRVPTPELEYVLGEDGIEYYLVRYTIKATMVGDILKFELVHNDISYGEVSTKFD